LLSRSGCDVEHAMARTDAREVKHSVRDGAQIGAPGRTPLPSRGSDSRSVYSSITLFAAGLRHEGLPVVFLN
jgi:hypothetical protein